MAYRKSVSAPQGSPTPAPPESGEVTPGPAPKRYAKKQLDPYHPLLGAGEGPMSLSAEELMAIQADTDAQEALAAPPDDRAPEPLNGFQPIYRRTPMPSQTFTMPPEAIPPLIPGGEDPRVEQRMRMYRRR